MWSLLPRAAWILKAIGAKNRQNRDDGSGSRCGFSSVSLTGLVKIVRSVSAFWWARASGWLKLVAVGAVPTTGMLRTSKYMAGTAYWSIAWSAPFWGVARE